MIDLAQIIEKIDARLAELGVTAAEVSAKATDSKDTIRNWKRTVEADRMHGTNKASATTIKLNQVESALGIELARNSSPLTPEAQLRSALLTFGVSRHEIGRALAVIKGFVGDLGGQSEETLRRDQSERANRHHEEAPSR